MTRKPAEFGGELPIFIFYKSGQNYILDYNGENFGDNAPKMPKKSGQKPGFENQKWAEKYCDFALKRLYLG